MSITLEDFFGEYTVSQGTRGLSPEPLSYGNRIVIEPSPSQEGSATVTYYDKEGEGNAFAYVLVDCSLWSAASVTPPSNPSQQAPLFTVISLYQDPSRSGFKSIYGLLVAGDPEQVGVFGAEGTGGNLSSS
ncbi:MAG: hypothetical protein SX243_16235 [Acidobacteriota bacterium]|nr:hypothetical protein [Acidobacteriota bacterium]